MLTAVETHPVLQKASELNAEGRYTDAIEALNSIPASDEAYPKAQSFLAQIHWVLSEDDKARVHADEALTYPIRPRTATVIRDRLEPEALDDPTMTSALTPAGHTFTHTSFYVSKGGNFGDAVLPWSVRRLVERQIPVAKWEPLHVHRLVTDEIKEQINATDGLVIGGGGLFLPDTMPNANSGWQWNISNENLRGITAPIAVTGVGFNLFPGQQFEGDLFKKSLVELVEKSTVFGLRNSGSVERIREMLPAELAEKITFLPCPTVLNSRLIPSIRRPEKPSERRVVHINAAYDRAGSRFGDDYGTFLGQIAAFITALPDDVEVRAACHLRADETLVEDLASVHGITVPIDHLYKMSAIRGLELYARSSLVIGMRGHASMLPFGVGTPILSLVSHPKLQYFLDDIEHPDWGVSVHDPKLAEKLTALSLDILDNPVSYRSQIADAQEKLDRISRESLANFIPALPISPALDIAYKNLDDLSRTPRVGISIAFDNAVNWAAPVAEEFGKRDIGVQFFVPVDERTALSRNQLTRIESYPIVSAHLEEIATQLVETSQVVVAQLPGRPASRLTQAISARLAPGATPPVVVGGFFGVMANNPHAGFQDRIQFDILSLNSEDDRALFAELADALQVDSSNLLVTGLALLPGDPEPQKTGPIKRVLYADQPTVPKTQAERLFVYAKLAEYATAHPDRTVVVKPRHRPGEDTFHKMSHSPESLMDTLELPENLIIDYTSISEQLKQTDLVLTVSSTAAIEALGHGCRVALLTDLGVRQELMNPIFLPSGLMRTFEEIGNDDIGTANEEWLASYFPAATAQSPSSTIVNRAMELLESGDRPGTRNASNTFVTSYLKARQDLAAIIARLEAEQAQRAKEKAAAILEAKREKEARREAARREVAGLKGIPRRLARRVRSELRNVTQKND